MRIGESGGDDFGDSRGEGQIGRRELVRGAEVAGNALRRVLNARRLEIGWRRGRCRGGTGRGQNTVLVCLRTSRFFVGASRVPLYGALAWPTKEEEAFRNIALGVWFGNPKRIGGEDGGSPRASGGNYVRERVVAVVVVRLARALAAVPPFAFTIPTPTPTPTPRSPRNFSSLLSSAVAPETHISNTRTW